MVIRLGDDSFLVALEGIEGSGKSVLSENLREFFEEEGFNILKVEEPTDFLESKIRENNGHDFHPEINALLFAADRLKQYDEVIRPAEEKNDIILMDRSIISSYAYQSSLDVNMEWIDEINRYMPIPDVVVFLDVDPEVGLDRISDRDEDSDFDEWILENKEDLFREFMKKDEVKSQIERIQA